MNEEEDDETFGEQEDETFEASQHVLETMEEYGGFICAFGMYWDSTFLNKKLLREPELTGYDWVMRTLNNPTSCYNIFRMSREVFYGLHDILVSTYGLRSTWHMSSIEVLAVFLWTIGAPQSIKQARNRFEKSTETITRKFEEVLHCVYKLSADIVKPRHPKNMTVHPRLRHPHFSPHLPLRSQDGQDRYMLCEC